MTLPASTNSRNAARDNGMTVSAPTTPRGHASKDVNDMIISIGREFDLPIRPRHIATSPSTRDDTLTERCVDSIVYLYFRNRLELDKIIETFRDDYRSGHTQDDVLKDFAERIRDVSYIEKHKPVEKLQFTTQTKISPLPPQLKRLSSPLKQTQLVPLVRKSSLLSQSDHQKSAVNLSQVAEDASTKSSPSRNSKHLSVNSPRADPKHLSVNLPQLDKDVFRMSSLSRDSKHLSASSPQPDSKRPSVNSPQFRKDAPTIPSPSRNSKRLPVSSPRADSKHPSVNSPQPEKDAPTKSSLSRDSKHVSVNSPQLDTDTSTISCPSRSSKRPLDQNIPSPVKYVHSNQNKRQKQSRIIDHFFSCKGSTTETSFGSTVNQTSASSVFSATNNLSFVSTVPTEPGSECDMPEQDPSSSYGELDLSQADRLMESFDPPRPLHDSFVEPPKPVSNSTYIDSNTPASNLRKGLEHRLVRSLPTDGLFIRPRPTPAEVCSMPYPLRWEHHRISNLLDEQLPCFSTFTELYNHLQKSSFKPFQKSPASVLEAIQDPTQAPNITYKASLAFTTGVSSEFLYNLTLQPLKHERASRLQRAFGSHRFLYLQVPKISRSNLPSHLKDQVALLKDRFLEWMCTEKQFLACKWRVFHIQDIKKKHSQVKDPGQRLVLFATEGPGMESTSLGNLLDWAIPLSYNGHQGFCKAYARLDLFLSQTIPTIIFKPSEVKFVKDTKADGTAECTLFDDPNLDFDNNYNPFNQAVMNDGCSLLSVGAAKEVCLSMGITGVKPVAFQGRINGCKGVWSISAPYDTTDPKHQAKWITITESQRKVFPRKEDLVDDVCEPDRWSLEVVKITSPPRSSTLYLDFIPILQDRHVSRSTLREVIESQIQLDFSGFLDSLRDPPSLRRWIHSQFATMEEINRINGLRQLGSLPVDSVERAIMLIESGFNPTECQYLADCMRNVSEFWLTQMKQKLKIHLGKSTMALGIADPVGCLKPGEIHMAFSETLRDETSGEVWSFLKGETLVARHPSLRNSDVQKVRAVFKEELSHLTDVVVFHTKGSIPLAHKLQGGDYDGDTFWLCWDRRLTSTFLNAPSPLDMRPLEYFGIQKDGRKLGELLGHSKPNIDNWLCESFRFKLQDDRLGQVTNFHKRLSYKENDISSSKVHTLADLHDLIIDSAKNGYTFTYSAWRTCIREKLNIRQSPYKPAYEKWMEPKSEESGEPRKDDEDGIIQPNYQHIIDFLLFKVVDLCIVKMQRTRNMTLECTGKIDTTIEKVFRERQASDNPIIKAVLKQLVDDVEKIRFPFNNQKDSFDLHVQKAHEAFIAIQPAYSEDSLIQEWLRRDTEYAFTTWELIRASAFYVCRQKKSTLVFLCAGRELCHIKAMGSANSRSVVDGVYATYKPKREKKEEKKRGLGRPMEGIFDERQEDGDDEGDEGDDGDDDDE